MNQTTTAAASRALIAGTPVADLLAAFKELQAKRQGDQRNPALARAHQAATEALRARNTALRPAGGCETRAVHTPHARATATTVHVAVVRPIDLGAWRRDAGDMVCDGLPGGRQTESVPNCPV